jgi:hypothetical protein
MPYPQTQNRKELTEQDFALYAAALSDLDLRTISAACEQYVKVGKFFPLPADIRALVATAEKSVGALVVEEVWERTMKWILRWYHADVGVNRHAPALEEKARRAAMAAGGFFYLTTCTEEELQWAKKRFVENYGHQETVEQSGALISSSEAKQILEKLRAPELPAVNQNILPASPAETEKHVCCWAQENPHQHKVCCECHRPSLNKIPKPDAPDVVVITDAMRARAQRQIDELKAKHPEEFTPEKIEAAKALGAKK